MKYLSNIHLSNIYLIFYLSNILFIKYQISDDYIKYQFSNIYQIFDLSDIYQIFIKYLPNGLFIKNNLSNILCTFYIFFM